MHKMNIENREQISEYLNDLLMCGHLGDIGTARTIKTEWYGGSIRKPKLGIDGITKSRIKPIVTGIKAELSLASDYTGAVDFYVNLGRIVKTDVRPKA